jgi:ubiquinone/menaquinone biosynthesis C-methylase UbiE
LKNSKSSTLNNRSNYQKFQSSNPIVKFLLNNFYSNIKKHISGMECQSFLDAGCGEGMTLLQLTNLLPPKVTAFDIDPVCVEYAKQKFPSVNFCVADITATPFEDNYFDVSVSLEVLEHLQDPKKGLEELLRITKRHVVLSVPHEPYFLLGSLFRGKYLKHFGRHPEHIQAWSSRGFGKFLAGCNVKYRIFKSFPWLIAVIDI